ncbi:hypothetical protein, partial [Desulfosporosinus fructosivorans]
GTRRDDGACLGESWWAPLRTLSFDAQLRPRNFPPAQRSETQGESCVGAWDGFCLGSCLGGGRLGDEGTTVHDWVAIYLGSC